MHGPCKHEKEFMKRRCVVCMHGDVRLVGGAVPNEGRVEVCSESGAWATVGNRSWDRRDASVVCRQLGYNATGGL